MALVETRAAAACSQPSLLASYKPDSTPRICHSPNHAERSTGSEEFFDNVDLSSCLDGLHVDGISVLDVLNDMSPSGPAPKNTSSSSLQPFSQSLVDDTACFPLPGTRQPKSLEQPGYFQKWMKTIHRRATRSQCRPIFSGESHLWKPLDLTDVELSARRSGIRGRSSSDSSFGYVAAVKSASVSLASTNTVAHAWRNTGRSRRRSKTDRSSRGSLTTARHSEESGCKESSMVTDRAMVQRALQRRRILEELISTEEAYIGDVRFLINVYVTILASLPTLPMGLRSSINRNLTEIIELHEELLGELHRAIPKSEYTLTDTALPPVSTSAGWDHRRWRSLDIVPEDRDAHRWLQCAPYMASEAHISGDVAKIFSRKIGRFFIYEEYSAKYEMLMKDVASTHHKLPLWDTYQRGLEALASSLSSASCHENQSRKSLTIGDLLVKVGHPRLHAFAPTPSLSSELLKHTPVDDDTNSHMEVEDVLLRLREATAEINRATSDPQMRKTLERTWILQDRLVFANQRIDAASKNRIRAFGRVELCGALYVFWQAGEGVQGQYMVCILYRDALCLASAGTFEQIYTLEACINLDSIKVEETDNGRGLQCHTAPFSWKLIFQCDSQLYEIIMVACTAKERDEWKGRLQRPIKERRRVTDPNLYSSLTLGIQSLGTVFSKPGTTARRISIQRATTIGPKSQLCHVILRNTSPGRNEGNMSANSSLNRSQSLHVNQRIPILGPHRGERARLETLLSDVWSREILPFPGTAGKLRGEHPILSSATTMMRKLSVANIANSLSRRSNSTAGMTTVPGEVGIVAGDESCSPPPVPAKQDRLNTRPFSWRRPEPVPGSTLPRVQDNSEKRGPTTTPSTTMFETAELGGLGRQDEHANRGHCDPTLPVLPEDIPSAEPGALRDSPNDGLHQGRVRQDSSSSKDSPLDSEEENITTPRATGDPKLTRQSNVRRVKERELTRDIMMRRIRSFFR